MPDESAAPSAPAPSARLRELCDGVHVIDAGQRFLGVEMGARATVLATGGDLLVHSPVDVAPTTLSALGTPRWVLAPNLFHHLYAGPWIEAGAEGWGVPGLEKKRPDLSLTGVIDSSVHPFGDDIWVQPLSCLSITNEVLVLHRPSGTLVATDLLFNVPPTAPWTTRAIMRCLGGYPGCRTTLIERLKIDRAVARKELGAVARWPFDRLIMAHGTVIDEGGKAAFVEALRWLDLDT